MTFPFPDNSLMYPSWWAGATTAKIIVIGEANATFAVNDIQLFSWGIAFPANEGADWFAGLVPWSQVISITRES